MNSIKGGETTIGSGHDSGGYYIIVDTGSSCEKRYTDTCEFPPIQH